MKQKTKLAIAAMIAAGVLVPAIYLACQPSPDPGSRLQETDATSWWANYASVIPVDYTTGIDISTDGYHSTQYYVVTWNQTQLEAFLGLDLVLPNGSSVIVRGAPVRYWNNTISETGTTYLFRHVNGQFYVRPWAISYVNRTFHEALLLGLAW